MVLQTPAMRAAADAAAAGGWFPATISPTSIMVALMIAFFTYVVINRAPRRPPGTDGPPGLPLIGNLIEHLIQFETLPDWINRYADKYGKNRTRCWAWTLPALFPGAGCGLLIDLNSPGAVKHVLKDNFQNYVKGDNFFQIMEEFLGLGIFSTDGKIWTMHRKIASHMFSRRLLTEGTKVAVRQSRTLVARLEAAAAAGATADLQDLFYRFTLDVFTMDVFTEISFGVHLKSLEREDLHPFAAAFDAVQEHCMRRLSAPTWKVRRHLGWLLPGERSFRASVRTMNLFSQQIITARRRKANDGSPLGPDLISRFLDKGSTFISGKASEGFSDKELRDLVLNFLIAGRDTTACALSWTWLEMLRRPAVLAKVRAEADAVFGTGGGKGSPAAEFTYENVRKLRFTQAVVTEALRLHPSVPQDIKYSIAADVLPDGTQVPANALVHYSPYALGRSPAVFEDPLAFKPERWLTEAADDAGSETKKKAPEPGVFETAVFNAGPRLCLGKNLAHLEIKLMTAVLARRFDFALAGPHSDAYKRTIVQPPKHGVRVRVALRKALYRAPTA